jgi:hypothetical protein
VRWTWILALGLAVMLGVIVYAWYRGGEESGALALAACV